MHSTQFVWTPVVCLETLVWQLKEDVEQRI